MTFSEWAYRFLKWEFPTSQPLWTPEEGLQSLVQSDGYVKQAEKSPQYFLPVSEQQKRRQLFDTMVIRENIVDLKGRVLISDVPAKVKVKVARIRANKNRYEQISRKFPNPIRWYHIGFLHMMECNLNFNCYLGNGQPLNQKTTIEPKGRGPFKSFEAGAIDAVQYDRLDKIQDWSIGNTLYILEGFNGYGYTLYRGTNSPYIFSGSNHYTAGYYISDKVYSKTTVSQQIGIALLIQELFKQENIRV